jgi:hypothetical protein
MASVLELTNSRLSKDIPAIVFNDELFYKLTKGEISWLIELLIDTPYLHITFDKKDEVIDKLLEREDLM